MKVLDLAIREQLAKYLAGQIPLAALQDWFIPKAWNIDKRGDLLVAELVHGIELRLAEYSSGHWTEDELKRGLQPFLTQYTIRMAAGPHMDSSVEVKEFQVVYPGASVDIQAVRAFS